MNMEYSKNIKIIKERLLLAHNKNYAKIRGSFFYYENQFFKKYISNSIVLVAGSGLGQDSFELSKYNKKVIGIDIISDFITYSLEKYKFVKNLFFLVSNINNLNYPNNYFDNSVLNMGTIGDFKNKQKLLKELSRVSKKVYFDFYPPIEKGLQIRKKMYVEEGWKNVTIKNNAVVSSDGLYSNSISEKVLKNIAKKLNAKINFYDLNEFSKMACLKK